MKKMLGILAVGLMLSGVINTASAVQIEIRGVPSCGDWVQEHSVKSLSALRQEGWFLGFVSGLATGLEKNFLAGTDNASLFLWMNNYCNANPLKDIEDGTNVLYFELKKQKNIK
jgi:hypothetical protein